MCAAFCFGVSAAVFYAAVILLNKYITGVPALERTFVQFLAAILVLTPYVALTSGFHPGVMSTTGWVNLLIVGLVHTGLTYCMYFSAIRALPGQESSLLSYIDPIVSVLVSVLLLGEPLAPVQIVGIVLFLGFAIVNELTHKNAQPHSPKQKKAATDPRFPQAGGIFVRSHPAHTGSLPSFAPR